MFVMGAPGCCGGIVTGGGLCIAGGLGPEDVGEFWYFACRLPVGHTCAPHHCAGGYSVDSELRFFYRTLLGIVFVQEIILCHCVSLFVAIAKIVSHNQNDNYADYLLSLCRIF